MILATRLNVTTENRDVKSNLELLTWEKLHAFLFDTWHSSVDNQRGGEAWEDGFFEAFLPVYFLLWGLRISV